MYELLIHCYAALIRLAAPFSKKAERWANGRKDWTGRLKSFAAAGGPFIWFHCCSLGEFEDGKAVIEAVRKRYPGFKIVLTFSSPSGYEARKQYEHADEIMYLPADTRSNAERFIASLHPALAVFVRNDIWKNYLEALKQKEIPVMLLSFQMGRDSNFIKWPQSRLYKKAFGLFDELLVQDHKTAALMTEKLGITKAIVTGNMRINNICEASGKDVFLPEIEKFIGNNFCVIAGSTLKRDESLFLETYGSMPFQGIRWIIVPHEIDEQAITSACRKSKRMIRYSEIEKLSEAHDLLWIDNVGMLPTLYRYAQIAFVGGGFNRIGVHNILEPAAYGCPVALGPRHRNYPEALELLNRKGIAIIKNMKELKSFILEYSSDSRLLAGVQEANRRYVFEKRANLEMVMDKIDAALKSRTE